MTDYKYDVSIVIVCMNNLKMLYPCLESIKNYTTCSYEVLVTAYLFTPENLKRGREDFPWVTFIESDEIRGFSENNNLSLRQAKGKYCFVLNDDTEMKMPVVEELVKTIEALPENVAIVSPVTTFPDGRVQVCGRPYQDWKTNLRNDLGIGNKRNVEKYCNKKGIFQSYNIIGAAFLIKTELFKNEGWFDERYFFCPEDIALSDSLNKKGYKCYVNNDVRIIHFEGMSGKSTSILQACTRPAMSKGAIIFFSHGNTFLYIWLQLWYFFRAVIRCIIHYSKGLLTKDRALEILAIGDYRVMCTIFSSKTPKEIFTMYYKKINK